MVPVLIASIARDSWAGRLGWQRASGESGPADATPLLSPSAQVLTMLRARGRMLGSILALAPSQHGDG